MVFAAVVLDHSQLPQLTLDYLTLKNRFFPRNRDRRHHLSGVLDEVKGADLRARVRGSRRRRRHAVGFLDSVITLLEDNRAKVLGRVWIKTPGVALQPDPSYCFAIQDIATHFNQFLSSTSDLGLMICDGRDHHQDTKVSHSIFTQKHRASGDAYPHLIEAVTFGRSVNHVGLQLADILAAGVLFPMACRAYCTSHITGVHVDPSQDEIRGRVGPRLKELRYIYTDEAARVRGGIVVSDPVGHRDSGHLFG